MGITNSSILNPKEELEKIYYEEIIDSFKLAIKPIYTQKDDKIPTFIESGILLAVKNKKYLVTAGHVIDECIEEKILIPSGDKLHKISINGFSTVSPNGDRSKDDFDYAWCVLSDEEVKNFEKSKFISEFYISDDVSQAWFAALGYPKSKNKFQTALGMAYGGFYAYTSNLIRQEGPFYFLEHTKNSINRDRKKFDNPINLIGMSGGALIDLGPYNWKDIIDASQQKLVSGKLIGLIIEKRNDKKSQRRVEEIKAVSLSMIVHSIKTKL